MRVMVLVKATKNSEAGKLPGEESDLELRPIWEAEELMEQIAR